MQKGPGLSAGRKRVQAVCHSTVSWLVFRCILLIIYSGVLQQRSTADSLSHARVPGVSLRPMIPEGLRYVRVLDSAHDRTKGSVKCVALLCLFTQA